MKKSGCRLHRKQKKGASKKVPKLEKNKTGIA